jgi:hypothetical protein
MIFELNNDLKKRQKTSRFSDFSGRSSHKGRGCLDPKRENPMGKPMENPWKICLKWVPCLITGGYEVTLFPVVGRELAILSYIPQETWGAKELRIEFPSLLRRWVSALILRVPSSYHSWHLMAGCSAGTERWLCHLKTWIYWVNDPLNSNVTVNLTRIGRHRKTHTHTFFEWCL